MSLRTQKRIAQVLALGEILDTIARILDSTESMTAEMRYVSRWQQTKERLHGAQRAVEELANRVQAELYRERVPKARPVPLPAVRPAATVLVPFVRPVREVPELIGRWQTRRDDHVPTTKIGK